MKKIKIIIGIFILLAATYSGGWFYMAHKINRAIDQFYLVDGPNQDILFIAERPKLSGFPLTPTVTYSSGVETKNYTLAFKEIVFTGFPIPQFPMKIEIFGNDRLNEQGEVFRQNIEFYNLNTNNSLILEHVELIFITPESAPLSAHRVSIEKWKKEVDQIDIKNIFIKADDIKVKGQGYLALDDNLQLDVNLLTRSYNYADIVNYFVSVGTIKPFIGAMSISGLDSAAKTDPTNNEKYVELDFMVKDNLISLGPLKLKKLEPIKWP